MYTCRYCGGEGAIRVISRQVEDEPVWKFDPDRYASPADIPSVIDRATESRCSMCGATGKVRDKIDAIDEAGGE